ncbi:putative polyprotein [Arabidopsis thaliana]|uniref:Putative polyprotein n=1 Tax=Arabidopsis thaliana TaxID=3702 RepID=Q9XEB9_ARATH|nr:putative polyprotein [Arabidopsis thaliana]CAB77909.1 putative polyprotein [Arabidopsis thaliana]
MENPKPAITSVVLKGENYLLWMRTTKTVLCGRGLWSHVETKHVQFKATKEDGDEGFKREEEEAEIEKEAKWFQEDQNVLAILQHSLESSILEAYSYCETARELWETLENVYGNVSNLTRVFEVKKAINNLSQVDLEFTKHFGKFRSLWAELEMLRPSTVDPAILNERKEQEKVFGLLLTLNPAFNDLIKHLLRADKLPSLENVCSQVQKEQGSLGLFSGKGELITAHKGIYKGEERKVWVCDHCKKKGHMKDKCWILHPHLKPAKFKANISQEVASDQGEVVRKSDLESLIRSIASLKESGTSFLTYEPNKMLKESGTSFFTSEPSKTLVIDSGASHHMINNPSLIDNIKPALGNVVIANGDKVPVKEIGELNLFDKKSKALYMPSFTSNLLSVKRATNDLNCYTIFGPNSVHFQDIKTGRSLTIYENCFDLVHSDVWTSPCMSRDNKKYFVTFIDEKSKYTWITLLPSKDCVMDAFINFQNYVTNYFNAKIKVLRSDNGGEYTSHKFKEYLAKHGIIHQTSCPYTPQQNGVAERKNRHLMEVERSMMFHTNVTKKFWGDAVMTACYLINRTPTKVLQDVSTFEFFEEKGYYEKKDWNSLADLSTPSTDRATSLQFLLDHLGVTPSSERETKTRDLIEEPITIDQENEQEEASNLQQDGEINGIQIHDDMDTQNEDGDEVLGLREKSSRLYYNNKAVAHPIQAVCSLALLPQDHQAFIGKIEANFVLQTYEEAKESEEWINAVADETGAMIRNHTWDEEDLPPGKRAVSSKWVFTIKYLSNGEIERHKARLVACGFTQTYGRDYTETFAPVAKLHTVRVVLSLATNLSWDLWQMDVKNAFLQGELEEEVYMTPPPGLEDSIAPGKVLRLRKAIYGLKQSPRAWYHNLSTTLKGKGFKKSEADHTLFTLQSDQGIIVALIYVDNIIISGDNKEGIHDTKLFLKSTFDIKDLGELKYFLGIEVCRSPEGLFLSQRKYTLDLLNETGKLGSKPAKTPLVDGYTVKRTGGGRRRRMHHLIR